MYTFVTPSLSWTKMNAELTIYYSTITSFCHIRSREHAKYGSVLHCRLACYTVSKGRRERKNSRTGRTKFRFVTVLKLDLLDDERVAAADSLNFIGFLFCHVDEAQPSSQRLSSYPLLGRAVRRETLGTRLDEAHSRGIKNEKVAAFCTLVKKYRCLMA